MLKLNIQLYAWQPGRIPAIVTVSADALPTHMTFSFLGTHSLEASALTRKLVSLSQIVLQSSNSLHHSYIHKSQNLTLFPVPPFSIPPDCHQKTLT